MIYGNSKGYIFHDLFLGIIKLKEKMNLVAFSKWMIMPLLLPLEAGSQEISNDGQMRLLFHSWVMLTPNISPVICCRKFTSWLSDWTELNWYSCWFCWCLYSLMLCRVPTRRISCLGTVTALTSGNLVRHKVNVSSSLLFPWLHSEFVMYIF